MSKIDYKAAAQTVKSGGLAVIPTDTVYGLVASANIESACKKLYELKNRDNKPGTVLASSIEQLVELGLKARYLKAVEQYWPNPISIVIPTGPILGYLHLGKYSLAVRIPKDKDFREFLQETGPLLSSSANVPSQPPAATIDQAKQIFGDKVDVYIDGGNLSERQSSTVIRVVDDAVEILRGGSLKVDESGKIS
jgi:L-threonylcarbamoyladenylate synthase